MATRYAYDDFSIDDRLTAEGAWESPGGDVPILLPPFSPSWTVEWGAGTNLNGKLVLSGDTSVRFYHPITQGLDVDLIYTCYEANGNSRISVADTYNEWIPTIGTSRVSFTWDPIDGQYYITKWTLDGVEQPRPTSHMSTDSSPWLVHEVYEIDAVNFYNAIGTTVFDELMIVSPDYGMGPPPPNPYFWTNKVKCTENL